MKRSLIVAIGVGALSVGAASPALAFWSSGAASSNATGFSRAGVLGVAGTVTATRTNPPGGGNMTATFTITAPPAVGTIPGQGYRVVEDTSGLTCTIGNVVGNSCTINNSAPGTKSYTVTTYAGAWIGPAARTCSFNNNQTTGTCS